MRAFAASIVAPGTLAKVVLLSLAASIGITVAFSATLQGAIRFVEMRRRGRVLAASALGVLTLFGLLVVAGVTAIGIVAMASK